ncbi:DNA-directed RNA polymerase subunit D [Methanogenium sp. S4BF]|uniref:DNA-directed RNA polymerase subunit D n=1 Tax=Methanogenium sp. S4BF TaxID=1789226 RepID=UPI00241771B4|nr:DNA-directed RNA polymerase subunit D [Methanogenium sp. S4BF]WFN35400.1 DNA-directed RNA polymerase subunit D [Methanogenium sp. S4BF]
MHLSFSRFDDDVARFVISGFSSAFVNALRRTMIGEVPTLAIEDVLIYDNNSALFDEMLAHRLGLIPLRTDLSEYVFTKDCSCNGEGCSACTSVYTLSVEGPRVVYSRDLIPQNPRAAPVEENIPLVKIERDQKIVLEARAVLGRGVDHAKWQPTLACGYKAYPRIVFDSKCDGCGMCVDECPRDVLEIKGKSAAVVEGKIEDCTLCKLCERICIANADTWDRPAISIQTETDMFIFVVEGDGSIPVRQILERAAKEIQTKSDSLVDVLCDISGGNVND